jgi:hypothetical protein
MESSPSNAYILDQISKLPQDTQTNGLIADALADGKPIANFPTMSQTQAMSRVESYLTQLYTALDDSHTAYEAAIRGDTAVQAGQSPDNQTSFGAPGVSDQPLAPPYSTATRAVGGDPRALAVQGSTAIDGIERAWEQVGTNLKNRGERARLQTELSQDQVKLTRLLEEQARLNEAQRTGSTTLGPDGDVATRLTTVQRQIDNTQNDISDKQAKLTQLATSQ